MEHIYEDLEWLTGERGLMTHMLPRALVACEPWLKEHVTDQRFWDGQYDVTHTGEIELPTPTNEDRQLMTQLYFAQPNPLLGKDVVAVMV
jgi:hypothetical protein